MRELENIKPGDPADALTAEAVRAIVAKIKARQSLAVAAPLFRVPGNGHILGISRSQGFYAKLSGTSSPYSFTEQYGTASGAWADGVRTGTTNAYEVNSAGSLNNKVVWLEPGYPGDYRFQYLGAGSGGGGDRGTFLGCLCTGAPATLTMTVTPSDCGDGLLSPCTFQYGPTPTELGPLNIGASSYLSTTSFTDPQTGDEFYYYLSCFSSIFRISRVFPSSIYGSPFLDAVVYYWTIGLPGNTCVPFSLTNGQIFFGGDPTCDVEINE